MWAFPCTTHVLLWGCAAQPHSQDSHREERVFSLCSRGRGGWEKVPHLGSWEEPASAHKMRGFCSLLLQLWLQQSRGGGLGQEIWGMEPPLSCGPDLGEGWSSSLLGGCWSTPVCCPELVQAGVNPPTQQVNVC